MAKRLTASEKWLDPWFCELSNIDKLAWLYILDSCNHAGIWQANWRLLNFYLGEKYRFNNDAFTGRIVEITPEKLFIPKFIEFQYGRLNPKSQVHRSVIALLIKEGVYKGYAKGSYTLTLPLLSPCPAPKAKDMDKDKAKDSSKDVKTLEGFDFDLVWSKYPRKLGRQDAERHFKASVKTPQAYQDIQNALDTFVREMRKEGRADDKIPYGSTWFNGQWRDWVNYGGVKMPKPPAPPPRPPDPPAPDLTETDLREMHDQRVGTLGPCREAGCRFCGMAAQAEAVTITPKD